MEKKEFTKEYADCDSASCSAKSSAMCGSAFDPTPIEFFGNVGGAELYVKRDDLIPVAMGGNKVRIAAEIFAEMSRRGCDAVITYGSLTSNLNRAVALMAKDAGVKCYAIVKQEKGRCSTGTGAAQGCGELTGPGAEPGAVAEKLPLNYRLVLASGAEVAETDSTHVGETVARVMAESRARGEKPFYVYGDAAGHGNEEVLSRAYQKVYGEILTQEQALFDGEYHFTEIFTAVGTGSTISGLIAAAGGDGAIPGMTGAGAVPGMTEAGAVPGAAAGERHITGISVARSREAVLAAIGPEDERFIITDEYLAPSSLEDFCITTSLAHAMPLDPVYTGKALFGTMEEIRKRGITGKVLFLHTGGTPLYYDMLEK